MTAPPAEIRFYRTRDAYGAFSNFAPYPIALDGLAWPTTEHYFQAQKFPDTDYQEAIRQASSAMVAARMGRSRRQSIRPDWESIKDEVMRKAVYAKFSQHEELRELLLGMGEARIVEHTERDSYWGDGGDGSGSNRLGEILMEIRDRLREETR